MMHARYGGSRMGRPTIETSYNQQRNRKDMRMRSTEKEISMQIPIKLDEHIKSPSRSINSQSVDYIPT